MIKKIVFSVLVAFIAMQFIQPARNKNGQESGSMATLYQMPDSVQAILKTACYDCHSNHTRYPWYTYLQPAGWMLSDHITKGKAELNFSEFAGYTTRRRLSKLRSITGQLTENKMPLPSYTLLHKNARLSQEQKNLVIKWVQQISDSLRE